MLLAWLLLPACLPACLSDSLPCPAPFAYQQELPRVQAATRCDAAVS